MAEEATPPFRVVYSQAVLTAVKDLHRQGVQQGRGESVLMASRAIHQRLSIDPRGFGEIHYHYRHLRLELWVGIEPPLVVHYTVHEELPIVFVKKFILMP